MSDDSKQRPRLGPIGAQTSGPAERVKQIQDLQAKEAADVQADAHAANAPAGPHGAKVWKKVPVVVRPPPGIPRVRHRRPLVPAGSHIDGEHQASVDQLFNMREPDSPLEIAPVWKIIPFSEDERKALADLPEEEEAPEVEQSPSALSLKQGSLTQLRFTRGEGAAREEKMQAVLVTDRRDSKTGETKKVIRGIELESLDHFRRALSGVPSFATAFYSSVFDRSEHGMAAIEQDLAEKKLKFVGIKEGEKSAYEVEVQRKNPVNGVWESKSALVNNFGMVVSAAEARKKTLFDIPIDLYRPYFADAFESLEDATG